MADSQGKFVIDLIEIVFTLSGPKRLPLTIKIGIAVTLSEKVALQLKKERAHLS